MHRAARHGVRGDPGRGYQRQFQLRHRKRRSPPGTVSDSFSFGWPAGPPSITRIYRRLLLRSMHPRPALRRRRYRGIRGKIDPDRCLSLKVYCCVNQAFKRIIHKDDRKSLPRYRFYHRGSKRVRAPRSTFRDFLKEKHRGSTLTK